MLNENKDRRHRHICIVFLLLILIVAIIPRCINLPEVYNSRYVFFIDNDSWRHVDNARHMLENGFRRRMRRAKSNPFTPCIW